MYGSRRNSEWSPSDITAVPTPTISRTPTLALDINNPADLEAQLLRLKERRDSDNSTTSASNLTCNQDQNQNASQTQNQNQNQEQNPSSQNQNQNPSSQNQNQNPSSQNQNQNPSSQNQNQNPSSQNQSFDLDLDLSPTRPKTLSTYLTQPIKPSSPYTLTQFLLLSLATGIIDATTFSLYSVFVSKQTGNTIFLALAALQHTSVSQTEPNIAISISLFFASAVIFGHLGHWIGASTTRCWLLISNLMSTTFIFAATAIRFFGPDGLRLRRQGHDDDDNDDGSSLTLVIIALLSVGMGAQVTSAFAAKIPDVNTTMVTGAIVQLATDGNIFGRDNQARTRRVMFFFAMLAGAFVGAGFASGLDATVGLFVAGLVKGVVTVMFLF